jgi:hypothetical protein
LKYKPIEQVTERFKQVTQRTEVDEREEMHSDRREEWFILSRGRFSRRPLEQEVTHSPAAATSDIDKFQYEVAYEFSKGWRRQAMVVAMFLASYNRPSVCTLVEEGFSHVIGF